MKPIVTRVLSLALCCFCATLTPLWSQDDVFTFDLPAQTLEASLNGFAKVTGLTVNTDGADVSASVRAVRGRYTAEECLDELFRDVDLSFVIDGKQVRITAGFTVQMVVGSQIQGLKAEGALPVTVVEAEELETVSANTFEEVLATSAWAGGVEFNGLNDGPNDARGDVAAVNLRGLGSGNTLVMLNGRRMVNHPTSQAINSVPTTVVNVNTIPNDAIDRVEVLRDGASALYGADATAGVVNTVLSAGYEGFQVRANHGSSSGTDFDETVLNFTGGMNFNGGRTNVSLFAGFFDRGPMFASERDYMASVDKRDFLPEDWSGDAQFRNLSTRSPYGEFQAGSLRSDGTFGGTRVRQDGSSVTSSSGRFHIQPNSSGGGVDLGNGLDLDDGSLNADLRYNFNDIRQVVPESERSNIFTVFNHNIGPSLDFFGEFGYYHADSNALRAAQPIDEGLAFLIVPKTNYYNPFGPVGSPNRLPDINAPDEGLDILIRRYRPVETGGRAFDVESNTLRLLAGLKGDTGLWFWESALLYNTAETKDITSGKLSKTFLEQQLALSTPDAFNPFGGPNANPQSVLDRVLIDSERDSNTSLTTLDFKISNPVVFNAPGGPAGMAAGLEYRMEDYEDDRDPRVDGTIIYRLDDISDQVGTSPTRDSSGDRDIFSAFTEVVVPLVGELNRTNGVHRLDLQVAARFENFSDVGSIVKPKIALSYYPVPQFLLRASYSEGFRAPNLVQINEGQISRLTRGNEDYWRGDVTGLPEDTGETYSRSIRQGNEDLEPEETETTVFGFVFEPVRNFVISADLWTIEQEGVIATFGVEESLALDFLLRQEGSSNPNVVRFDVNEEDQAAFDAWNAANPNDQRAAAGLVNYIIDPYLNLDPRTVEGLDISLRYRTDRTRYGRFSFRSDINFLQTYDQENVALEDLLNSPEFADEFTAVATDRLKINGNPELRWTAGLTWRQRGFGAGVFAKYIDEFYDTSATNDDTGEFWTVDSWLTFNLNINYTARGGALQDTRFSLSGRNISDEEPPLADESLGYFGSYHNNRGRFIRFSIKKSF